MFMFTIMKKLLFFLVFIVFFTSCHKNKNDSCNGSFVVLSSLSYLSPSYYGLFPVNISTGFPDYSQTPKFGVGNIFGYRVYDHRRNYYYIYSINDIYLHTPPPIFLNQFNLNSGVTTTFQSAMCDTIGAWSQDLLLCNSTANKLYLIDHGRPTDRILRSI